LRKSVLLDKFKVVVGRKPNLRADQSAQGKD